MKKETKRKKRNIVPLYQLTYPSFTVPNCLNTLSVKYTITHICKICPEESVI